MSSLIEGYNYDIFISYRQKDNKYDGWVSEFVENLKKELEATFKESINLYFDINPHGGLLETHEIQGSLENKLKSFIFIPIISRTYCDPQSYAWQNEFVRFVEMANADSFGLRVKLQGGNVASRILPIMIHDIDKEDIRLCETILGGPLRGIEFIYTSPGVNRPLRANEDHSNDNINKTYYRDQINKVAQSIHELILGISSKNETGSFQIKEFKIPEQINHRIKHRKFNCSKRITILSILASTILILLAIIFLPKSRYNSVTILQKAILAADPYGIWPKYKGVIRLRNIRINAELELNEIIEIDRGADSYLRTRLGPDRKEIIGVKNGMYFQEVLNANNEKVKLTKQDSIPNGLIAYTMEHHTCLFGLLMELKNSGLKLNKKADKVNFQGVKCYSLRFIYDSTLNVHSYFKKNWTVYINRKDNSLKGYHFDTKAGNMYLTVFSGRFNLNYINVPMCITYYLNSDDTFLWIDLITRPEKSN